MLGLELLCRDYNLHLELVWIAGEGFKCLAKEIYVLLFFFTFYFYLLLPSLNHLLKCLTGGAQVQLPLDTSCLCACVLYQISLFSSCMASSSGLFHSINIFWPHRIQPASRADPRIPSLFKVGQERRRTGWMCEKEEWISRKMIQEPAAQASSSCFLT